MQYTTTCDGGRVEMVLSGRLTFTDVGQFLRFLDDAAVGRTVCELDLGGLSFVDSTGLSLFIHVYDAARRSGQKVVMRNAAGAVAEVLRRAHFDTVFEFR